MSSGVMNVEPQGLFVQCLDLAGTKVQLKYTRILYNSALKKDICVVRHWMFRQSAMHKINFEWPNKIFFLLCRFTASSLRRFTALSLRRFTASPLHCFTASLLHCFATSPPRCLAALPLYLFASSLLCCLDALLVRILAFSLSSYCFVLPPLC